MRVCLDLTNAGLDLWIARGNSGILRGYDDSAARPAGSDVAVPGGSVLLCELTMNATSFVRTDRLLTANAITADSSANATGDLLWFRLWEDDGTTPVCDFGCSTSAPSDGAELQLPTLAVVATQAVSATALTIAHPIGA